MAENPGASPPRKRPRPAPLPPCLQPRPGRAFTVSVALPGSVLLKQDTLELKSRLASRLARAIAIFRADEVVVFDEAAALPSARGSGGRLVDLSRALQQQEDAELDPALHLALLLQFLECPQYLRRHFFPVHPALAKTGLMDPLALPSHVARDEAAPYREGVVIGRAEGGLVRVEVGLGQPMLVRSEAPVGARVTLRMREGGAAKVVPPSRPRRKSGLYWGFQVRLVNGLSGVLHGCPFDEEGYDLVIGTSERGDPVQEFDMPPFKHLLIVFGGPEGLEVSMRLDEALGTKEVRDFFPTYLNTCSDQGSRTIRTEEAVLVTMAALDGQIRAKGVR